MLQFRCRPSDYSSIYGGIRFLQPCHHYYLFFPTSTKISIKKHHRFTREANNRRGFRANFYSVGNRTRSQVAKIKPVFEKIIIIYTGKRVYRRETIKQPANEPVKIDAVLRAFVDSRFYLGHLRYIFSHRRWHPIWDHRRSLDLPAPVTALFSKCNERASRKKLEIHQRTDASFGTRIMQLQCIQIFKHVSRIHRPYIYKTYEIVEPIMVKFEKRRKATITMDEYWGWGGRYTRRQNDCT